MFAGVQMRATSSFVASIAQVYQSHRDDCENYFVPIDQAVLFDRRDRVNLFEKTVQVLKSSN